MTDTLPSAPSASSSTNGRETVCERIVEAVAEAEGVSPLELQPLGNVVDPHALERLVASVDEYAIDPRESVQFRYAGYVVTVTGEDRVEVEPDGDRAP